MLNNRVLLAISGGVDSSVAAYLLQQMGYEVVGLTFIFWKSELTASKTETHSYMDNAHKLAEQLGIRHYVKDVSADFKTNVLDYFYSDYLNGRTPFPCVVCNNTVKWFYLEQFADSLNCSYLATGHYANIVYKNPHYYLTVAEDQEKDQTFFLWGLPQNILAKSLFPLGNLYKTKVKEIAENLGWKSLVRKKESMGPCFTNGNDYRSFLDNLMTEEGSHPGKGYFLNENGKILGEHNGYPYFTIGQRRGLGINHNKPYYVKSIDPVENTVILSDKKSLFVHSFYITSFQFVNLSDVQNKELIVKIRYRKQATLCRIEIIDHKSAKVNLLEPLDSVAAGQTAVFYEKNKVMGGGFIL